MATCHEDSFAPGSHEKSAVRSVMFPMFTAVGIGQVKIICAVTSWQEAVPSQELLSEKCNFTELAPMFATLSGDVPCAITVLSILVTVMYLSSFPNLQVKIYS